MYLSQLAPLEKAAFFRMACRLVAANGVTTEEESMLNAAQRELGLENVDELRQTPVEIAAECAAFKTPQSKKIVLLELLLLAKADGLIQAEEQALLHETVEHLGMPPETLARAQDWAESLFTLFQTGMRFIGATRDVPAHAVR